MDHMATTHRYHCRPLRARGAEAHGLKEGPRLKAREALLAHDRDARRTLIINASTRAAWHSLA